MIILRTPSVLSGLHKACNTTLYFYRGNSVLPDIKDILDRSDIHIDLLPLICKVTIQVCLLYYCRIQELLNTTISDIIYPDRVLLKGLKKSLDYIIYLPGLSNQIDKWEHKNNMTMLFPITYNKLYRSLLKAGIGKKINNSNNKKRLHIARYDIINKLTGRVSDLNASSILRHRSRSSLQYYQQQKEY